MSRIWNNTYTVAVGLGAILLLALFVRVWGMGFGLPYRYHIDEPAYVVNALRIAHGELKLDYPPLSPSLHQILLAVSFGVLYVAELAAGKVSSPTAFANSYQLDATGFYLIARGWSILCSVAAIYLLYLIVSRRQGRRTGLVACLFLALSMIDVRHAHFAEPYSMLTLFVLLAVYAALVFGEKGATRWLAVSALAAGIAIGIKYSVLPVALVPVGAVGLRFWQGRRQELKVALRQLVYTALFGLAGVLIGTPSLLLNPRGALQMAGVQAALATTAQGFWGIQFTNWPTWWFYLDVLEIGWGWPLVILAAAGLGRVLWSRQRQDFLILLFPVLFAALLLQASAASSAFARYSVPALPFLAWLAAIAVVWVVDWAGGRWNVQARTVALVVVAGALVIIPAIRIVQLDHLWTQVDTRTLAKEWIETQVPAGSKIAMQWYGPALATATHPEANSSRVYDVLQVDPFDSSPNWYSLDYYRSQGFDYLVLSSFIYDLRRIDPRDNQTRSDFYQGLASQADLVAEFRPFDGKQEPPFFFEELWGPITALDQFTRPGPTIQIYRITQPTPVGDTSQGALNAPID
ncbi:MAG: glycosyltransferase family 39 protein [Anaerolineae bacterium]